jgi:hypothetical protein
MQQKHYLMILLYQNTTNEKIKSELQDIVNIYKKYFKMLEADGEKIDEITLLAKEYMREKIIPLKNFSDAFHVAYSTVFEMDILLSLNFKHWANVNKEQRILIVNKIHGYNYPLRLANTLKETRQIKDNFYETNKDLSFKRNYNKNRE